MPSPAARKHLLFEAAAVLQEQLSEREGAMEAYREVLSVDPEDPNALRLLGDALGAAERWEDLVDVLGREADVVEGRPNLVAEAAELRFRLGRIRQQRLADTAGALSADSALVAAHAFILFALVSAGVTLATLSWRRSLVWKDSVSLWDDAITRYPGVSSYLYFNRGVARVKM